MKTTYDLAVIGGGPAGLVAATQSASLGIRTVLVDEQSEVGGQIYRSQARPGWPGVAILGSEYGRRSELEEAFASSGADRLGSATVFEVDGDGWIGISCSGAARFVKARSIILATGALERPFPIPGWTLPGVMTAGAAQILLKTSGVVPGNRTVLAGCGPLLYLVATQLLRAGTRVAAILDTMEGGSHLRAAPRLFGAMSEHAMLAKGLGMLATIRRAGIPHIRRVDDLRAVGGEKLSAVVYRADGREGSIPADLLLLHQGVVPNVQLAGALRCALDWDERQLCWKPVTDEWGRTSLERIWAAGDGSGILGAQAAELSGRLAALSVAQATGHIAVAERDRLARPIRRRLDRQRRFRRFIDELYRPQDRFRIPSEGDTIVCRCEEVRLSDIRAGMEAGFIGPNQLKAVARAGMGPCQGRYCGLTVCEIIADARRVSPQEVGHYRLRMPVKPVALGELAEMTVEGTHYPVASSHASRPLDLAFATDAPAKSQAGELGE